MSRDRWLLELGACQGGATAGYQAAGWRVIAVDVKDHSAVNPAEEFHVVDPATPVAAVVERFRHRVKAGHGSPPCQRFTHGNAGREAAEKHPDLIAPWRDAFRGAGLPYILENVPRAPLLNPVTLCGTQFDLTTVDDDGTVLHLKRHRMFESDVLLTAPGPCVHPAGVQWAGAYGGARRDKHEARDVRKGGYVPPKPVLERLLGIDWMTEYGLFQSLPPAYTAHLGAQLLSFVDRSVAA
jgi:DNA (cytosine-5)-methyltransferase 1